MLEALNLIAIFLVSIVIVLAAVGLLFTVAFGLLYLLNRDEFSEVEEIDDYHYFDVYGHFPGEEVK